MKADAAQQRLLLDLADTDTALVRVAHKRRALPEDAAVATAQAAVGQAVSDEAAATAVVTDLNARQATADAEVEVVRARIDRNRRLMDGSVAAKELAHIEHETQMLTGRQTDLEDAELAIMEELESAQSVLDRAASVRVTAASELASAEARRNEALAALTADEEAATRDRDAVVAAIAGDLFGLYESVRASTGDTGAALLTRGRCQGCHLDLPATAIDDVRSAAPDDVVQCEECLRILVRTEASGL